MKSSDSELKEKYFLPYQAAWLKDKSLFKVFEKSRRIGGTYVQSFEDVDDLINMERLPAVYFSSADLSAAAEYIRYAAKWAKVYNVVGKSKDIQVIEEDGIKTFVVELINGKRIHALSSNPKAFRSKGGKLVLDEFAFHDNPEDMWKAARPIVTWGYPVRILSTHNGVNSKFNRFIKDIKRGKLKWGLHTVTIHRAVEDGLVDKIMGRKTTEAERLAWLEEARGSCGDEATWLQEFCCQPTDENSAFLTYELIFAIEREGLHADLSKCIGDLYLGYDVARRGHGSVIYVLERLGHILYERKRINMEKRTFAEQKQELFPLLALPNMRRACIDETGLGMQIAEEAQQAFGKFKVEAVNFGGSNVKSELAYGLYTEIEDRTLLLERDEKARESLHSVKKIVTNAGNIRFDAAATEQTGHGDYFWALALARHACRTGKTGDPQVDSRPRGGEDGDNARTFLNAFSPFRRVRDALKGF
jgi:phage FluMu gp28-like protein